MTLALFLDLAWRLKECIAIAILAALLLFAVSSCSSKARDIVQIKTEHELIISQKDLAHANNKAAAQAQANEQVIKAVNEYQEREQVIIADAASARDAVTSLSDTLADVSAAAAANSDFQRAALGLTGDLLTDCSGKYSDLAEQTDRIENSLRATIAANK